VARGEMGMRFRFIATICVMSDFDAITVNEIVLPSLARTFDPDDSVAGFQGQDLNKSTVRCVLPWIGYAEGAGIRTIGKIWPNRWTRALFFAFRLSGPWAVESKFKNKIQRVSLF